MRIEKTVTISRLGSKKYIEYEGYGSHSDTKQVQYFQNPIREL